ELGQGRPGPAPGRGRLLRGFNGRIAVAGGVRAHAPRAAGAEASVTSARGDAGAPEGGVRPLPPERIGPGGGAPRRDARGHAGARSLIGPRAPTGRPAVDR